MVYSSSLLPFPLELETGPVVRRLSQLLLHLRNLRLTERRRRSQPHLQNIFVELFHQFRGGLIIDLPETCQNARRPGIHKSRHHVHQASPSTSLPSSVSQALNTTNSAARSKLYTSRSRKKALWGLPFSSTRDKTKLDIHHFHSPISWKLAQ